MGRECLPGPLGLEMNEKSHDFGLEMNGNPLVFGLEMNEKSLDFGLEMKTKLYLCPRFQAD